MLAALLRSNAYLWNTCGISANGVQGWWYPEEPYHAFGSYAA